MKRTKKWWSKFTPEERSTIVYYEKVHGKRFSYSRSPNLPDDSYCCKVCGSPYGGKYTCDCKKEYNELIKRENK